MRTVVVKSVDVAAVRRALDAYVARLFTTRADVEEVVVFGSFAHGSYAPGSDLDLLVVLREADGPVRDRIPSLLPREFPVGLDIFPYTQAELAERPDSPVVEDAAASRWRYRRPGPAPLHTQPAAAN